MGKPAYKNAIIQITLDKEIIKAMDGVIEAGNKLVDTSKGEKKITRSKFISDCIVLMFNVAPKFKIEKSKKGEKKDA